MLNHDLGLTRDPAKSPQSMGREQQQQEGVTPSYYEGHSHIAFATYEAIVCVCFILLYATKIIFKTTFHQNPGFILLITQLTTGQPHNRDASKSIHLFLV